MSKGEQSVNLCGWRQAIGAAALVVGLGAMPARADTKVFGCSIIDRYSQSQVHAALAHARAFVDAGEINSL